MEGMTDGLLIEGRAVEPFLKNGFLLACAGTRQGILIDPGEEVAQLLEWAQKAGIELTAIVNTHAHLDHICGIGRVRQRWNIPIYLHPDDGFLYEAIEEQGRALGWSCPPVPAVDRPLSDGQELAVGRLRVTVHHTPGHSPGSVSLEVENHLFCGDLIFSGSVGRTDLPGGSYETLMRSIQEKILPLGDAKILHPGHGPDTTIGQERRTNPFLS